MKYQQSFIECTIELGGRMPWAKNLSEIVHPTYKLILEILY